MSCRGEIVGARMTEHHFMEKFAKPHKAFVHPGSYPNRITEAAVIGEKIWIEGQTDCDRSGGKKKQNKHKNGR